MSIFGALLIEDFFFLSSRRESDFVSTFFFSTLNCKTDSYYKRKKTITQNGILTM